MLRLRNCISRKYHHIGLRREGRAAHLYGNMTCKSNCSLCPVIVPGKLQKLGQNKPSSASRVACSIFSVLVLPDPGFFLVPDGELLEEWEAAEEPILMPP